MNSNPASDSRPALFTTSRWIEVGRIALVGVMTLLYWRQLLPLPALYAAIAIGLYPLAKRGVVDLWRERKIGTEIFVTVATIIAMVGKEYVAGAVLMTIILIAEFIAELNTDRARASIKALIGSVPQTALIRDGTGVVLVRGGEKIPVDGTVIRGQVGADNPGHQQSL